MKICSNSLQLFAVSESYFAAANGGKYHNSSSEAESCILCAFLHIHR